MRTFVYEDPPRKGTKAQPAPPVIVFYNKSHNKNKDKGGFKIKFANQKYNKIFYVTTFWP